ncbi:hypothetical protein HK104_004977, partial [Borealophlyctis nickersoniae]
MNVNQVSPELIAKVLAYLPIPTVIDLPEVSKYFNLATRHFLLTHLLRNLHAHLLFGPDPSLLEEEYDYCVALVKHVFPKLKAVCPVAVEAMRKTKREILEENGQDLNKLMKEKGMTDEEAFLDSLDEMGDNLLKNEGGWPSVNYYKDYMTINGYRDFADGIEDLVWTLYPRKDGDFVVFECPNAVVPFGFGEKEVTLEIDACFEPKGCDGDWGRHTAFKLFSSERVKLGSAVEEKGGPEGEEDSGDGGWGGGDDVEEDERPGGSSASAVGDDGNATLEGNGFSITCQVERNVCKTKDCRMPHRPSDWPVTA